MYGRQVRRTNPKINITMGPEICSGTLFTVPLDNLNVNKLHSSVLYYWIFCKDLPLIFCQVFSLQLTFQSDRKKQLWVKANSSFILFQHTSTVISLSPFISWWALFLCLLWTNKKIFKNHCKTWDLLEPAIGQRESKTKNLNSEMASQNQYLLIQNISHYH